MIPNRIEPIRLAHTEWLKSFGGSHLQRWYKTNQSSKEAALAEKRESRADAGLLADLDDGLDSDRPSRAGGPECD